MDEKTMEILKYIKNMRSYTHKRKCADPMQDNSVKDITLAQLDIMGYLYHHKRAKMSELARNANVKMPSMTESVNKLVRLGALTREHDEKDRRTVWVSITKNVEEMVGMHIRQKDDEINSLMSALTEKEKDQAINIMKKIIKKYTEREK